jgi:hypothetical protein
VYAGFIISGVDVEISSITIKEGDETVFASAAASHSPILATAITISAKDAVGADDNYDYQAPKASFPVDGVQLSAAAVEPEDADDPVVTWSINDDASGFASVDSDGLVKFTGAGTATVTATTTNGVTAEFKFNITEAATPVESVTVSGPDTVLVGNTITLEAAITPTGTIPGATWSLTANGGGDGSTIATIAEDTGVLTGVGAGTVLVYATSVGENGSGQKVVSEAHTVTVKVVTTKTLIFDNVTSWSADGAATEFANLGVTVGAAVEYSTNNKSLDSSISSLDTDIDGKLKNRLDFKGAYSSSNNTRYIAIAVEGPCTIKAYILGASSARKMTLASALGTPIGGTEITTDTTESIKEYSFSYTGEAGTVYLYGTGNSVSMYGLSIEY